MRSVFLYLLLFVTAFLSAQEPVVMSELDRDSIQIGEQVNYKIKLQSKVPLKSLVPDFEQDRVSGLEILNSESDSGKLEDYNYSFNYLITSFDSGVYEIPEIEILYNDGVKAETALSPSLTLIVFTPPVDTSQAIKDIKPLLKTPLSFQEILSFWQYNFRDRFC